MIDISSKTYERNDVETIVESDGILRLNEKRIEEGLDHKKLQVIKYSKKSFRLWKL